MFTATNCAKCNTSITVQNRYGGKRVCNECRLERRRLAARNYKAKNMTDLSETFVVNCVGCGFRMEVKNKYKGVRRCFKCKEEQHRFHALKSWNKRKGV